VAKGALEARFPYAAIRFESGTSWNLRGKRRGVGRSLFDARPRERFDVVIVTPPYVRTQIMGASHAQGLASHFWSEASGGPVLRLHLE